MRSGERKLKPEEMAGGSAVALQPEERRWGSLKVSEGSSRREALLEPHPVAPFHPGSDHKDPHLMEIDG